MRVVIFFLLFFSVFSQYVVIKKALPEILSVYSPVGYVENNYSIRIFLLNNGTEVLHVYSISVDDNYHSWTSYSGDIIVPPGYLAIIPAYTFLSCTDFGKTFSGTVYINTSEGVVSKSFGPFTAESPITISYEPAVLLEVGRFQTLKITFRNLGENKKINLSLSYPSNVYVRLLYNTLEIPYGEKNIYLRVISTSPGYNGEINITFQSDCPYLISPESAFIKINSVVREPIFGRFLYADEFDKISLVIFSIILVWAGSRVSGGNL